MFKVRKEKLLYSEKPADSDAYTKKMDRVYTRYAKAYDVFTALFPLWKKWLRSVLPYVKGSRVIDISFGPGYMFSKLPENIEMYGLDYNDTMVRRVKKKLEKKGIEAQIEKGNVENMPYEERFFDTVINTMAFSGYPDGEKALSEMLRVLKENGVLLILDYDYPAGRNVFGYLIVKLIEKSGDIIKDIGALVEKSGCKYERITVGGFGSVQLFIIAKH